MERARLRSARRMTARIMRSPALIRMGGGGVLYASLYRFWLGTQRVPIGTGSDGNRGGCSPALIRSIESMTESKRKCVSREPISTLFSHPAAMSRCACFTGKIDARSSRVGKGGRLRTRPAIYARDGTSDTAAMSRGCGPGFAPGLFSVIFSTTKVTQKTFSNP